MMQRCDCNFSKFWSREAYLEAGVNEGEKRESLLFTNVLGFLFNYLPQCQNLNTESSFACNQLKQVACRLHVKKAVICGFFLGLN